LNPAKREWTQQSEVKLSPAKREADKEGAAEGEGSCFETLSVVHVVLLVVLLVLLHDLVAQHADGDHDHLLRQHRVQVCVAGAPFHVWGCLGLATVCGSFISSLCLALVAYRGAAM
jgi:hypothetical protein